MHFLELIFCFEFFNFLNFSYFYYFLFFHKPFNVWIVLNIFSAVYITCNFYKICRISIFASIFTLFNLFFNDFHFFLLFVFMQLFCHFLFRLLCVPFDFLCIFCIFTFLCEFCIFSPSSVFIAFLSDKTWTFPKFLLHYANEDFFHLR